MKLFVLYVSNIARAMVTQVRWIIIEYKIDEQMCTIKLMKYCD